MSVHEVARLDDIPDGGHKIVEVQGRSIGVFREGDTCHALLNVCPHAGAPVCEGRVTGRVTCDDAGQLDYRPDQKTLRCPWHHWEFDLATGRALIPGVKQRLRVYPVHVSNGLVQVEF